MQEDIRYRTLVDRNERLGDRINESVGGDESDPGVDLRLRNQMLGAAEADLEPQRIDRHRKKRAWIGWSRPVQVECQSRQQRLEQRRLTRLERMAFAAPEKSALRSVLLATAPAQAAFIRRLRLMWHFLALKAGWREKNPAIPT